MSKSLFTIPLVGLATVMAACASASKIAEQPGLVIPPPPAHVVPITPEPVVEPVGEIPAPPSSTAPAARPGRGGREGASRTAASEAKPEAKPDVKPGETSQPETTPAPVAPPPPAPQLRTAESTGAETTVRATIDRARGLLNSIDYRRLIAARKKAYDDAKEYVQRADEALRTGNVVFAQGVATKAETLAKELSNR